MTSLKLFAAELQAKQREERRKRHSKPWVPTATSASSLGYRCERRLVYQRVDPALAAPPNEELSSIFEEGDLHHVQIRKELADLGFEVLENESPFFDERLDIRGHIDGKLKIDGKRYPIELKSTMGQGPQTQEIWARETGLFARYYAQLMIYMFLTNTTEGLGLFKDKVTGLWTVCAVELDYAFAETLLKRAERVRDAVRMKVLPDRILDRSECRGCPFELVCLPGDAPVDPLLIAEDEKLIDDMRAREALRRDAGFFKSLDEKIKERFKLTKGERFIAGEFIVTKRTTKSGAVYVETEVAPGAKPEPPKVADLIADLKRSLGAQQ